MGNFFHADIDWAAEQHNQHAAESLGSILPRVLDQHHLGPKVTVAVSTGRTEPHRPRRVAGLACSREV